MALDAWRRGRRDGLADGPIVARDPVVLALTPPAIGTGGAVALPAPVGDGATPERSGGIGALGCRDALRLRSRWAQELGATPDPPAGGGRRRV